MQGAIRLASRPGRSIDIDMLQLFDSYDDKADCNLNPPRCHVQDATKT